MSQEETPFEKEFTILRELGEEAFVLRGSNMIVYQLPDEEIKTKSGLILATDSKQVMGNSIEQNKLNVGKVLMTGPGYWNGEGYDPLEVKPGAIVVLPQYSTSPISVFPGIGKPTGNRLVMVKEDSIIAFYPSQEIYENTKRKLT